MSLERKRWAQKAQELRFHQLDAVRRQAEGWRTGLGGVTALLAAVLVVKGRDNISTLATPFRWSVALLLGLALGLLVAATLLAVRAASGAPGEDIVLSGEELKAWTAQEVRRVSRVLRRATVMATTGVALVGIAVGCTWLGPADKPQAPLIAIEHDSGQACGRLVEADRTQIKLREERTDARKGVERTVRVPLGSIGSMKLVSRCP